MNDSMAMSGWRPGISCGSAAGMETDHWWAVPAEPVTIGDPEGADELTRAHWKVEMSICIGTNHLSALGSGRRTNPV